MTRSAPLSWNLNCRGKNTGLIVVTALTDRRLPLTKICCAPQIIHDIWKTQDTDLVGAERASFLVFNIWFEKLKPKVVRPILIHYCLMVHTLYVVPED